MMIKNKVLADLADLLRSHEGEIISQNKLDLAAALNLDATLIDRLKVDENKVAGMINSVEEVMAKEDPEDRVLSSYRHPNGMIVENRVVPFGTILIIYESRPDVTIEAAISAFKAGNKLLLKGGKEASKTNSFLVKLWHQALVMNDIDSHWVIYLELDRQGTQKLIRENTHRVDLIIPRGGDGLINFIRSNTAVPILVSGRGNNFVYVDKDCDFEMALRIILDGKKRLSVCNAVDKVLFNQQLPKLKESIGLLKKAMQGLGIEVVGTPDIHQLDASIPILEGDHILYEEFLSAKIYFGLSPSVENAVQTINQYSGGHSASIISTSDHATKYFLKQVDCAAVYHNASTRFTDGGQFGLGAEMAISTQKLHFRGPIGLEQLVTNKWIIYGDGQTRN